MGFASGSVTYQKFYMVGQHPSDLTDEMLASIENCSFGRYKQAMTDDLEFGWIVPNHLFDVDFSSADRILVGRSLYLAMRCDRTAPPASLVKSYEKMEELAALEASGKETLSKNERSLAREVARDRAAEEAKKGHFRRMSAYPLIIDLEEGSVYFGNLGLSAADKLLTLFSDTFSCSLVQASIEEVAYRIATDEKLERVFDDIKPALLVRSPAGDDSTGQDLADLDKKHLGREFLTWFWYRSEVDEGVFELGQLGTVTIAIDKVLSLRCCFDQTGTTSIRTDVPSSSPEARAALRLGKMPERMGLIFGSAQGDWACTLNGATLAVSGLSLPRSEDTDPAFILEERVSGIRTVSSVIDSLVKVFMKERLSQNWSHLQQSMTHWVEQPTDQGSRATVRLATA